MGANNGTGWPYYFCCSSCRKRRRSSGTFDVELTGKTKPYRGGNKGVRGALTCYQYKCTCCDHVGWSRHVDLERKAKAEIKPTTLADVAVWLDRLVKVVPPGEWHTFVFREIKKLRAALKSSS